MKRLLAGLFSAAALAMLAGACDDSPPDRGYGYGGAPAYSGPHCGQYSACGTCTPALGCGWCMTGGGAGLCVEDPGDCPEATTLAFTWETNGCHAFSSDASIVADAQVGGGDAGASDAAAPADARSDVY